MALVQLGARGTYGPFVPWGPGVSNLWSYMRMPPAQKSIIIYNDGSVVEGQGFELDDVKDPGVYLFILGGTRFRCQDDSFEYNALVAAGYDFTVVPERDTYTDDYQDVY